MKFLSTVVIDATPAQVFPWIDDPVRGKKWSASVAAGEMIDSTPERVGSTFREVVGHGDHTLEMTGVITQYVKNERFAVHVESERHVADISFTLFAISGHTELTREVDLRLKGIKRYAAVFLRPMIKKNIRQESQAEFSALKRFCELEARQSEVTKEAQPGATDNPDTAQPSRESFLKSDRTPPGV